MFWEAERGEAAEVLWSWLGWGGRLASWPGVGVSLLASIVCRSYVSTLGWVWRELVAAGPRPVQCHFEV